MSGRRKERTARGRGRGPAPSKGVASPADVRLLALPLALSLLLAVFAALLPAARHNPSLTWSLWGTSAPLLVWDAVLFATRRRRPRALNVQMVLRQPHYLQACVHSAVFLYWGWYWHPVYDWAYLIAAQ